MAVLRHVATWLSGLLPFRTGITDLVIGDAGGAVQLYAISPLGGGLSAFGIGAGGALQLVSQHSFSPGVTHLSVPRIAVLDGAGGGAFLLPFGMMQAWADAWLLDGAGAPAARLPMPAAERPAADVIALTSLSLQGQTYIIAACSSAAGVLAYQAGTGGGLRLVTGATGTVAGPVDIASLVLGVGGVVIGVCPISNMVVSYRVGVDGALEQAARLESLASGIGFDTPVAVATATLGGVGYAIVAGAGSSSLTVLRVSPDGRMQAVDHVIDTLTTRFQAVVALEVVTLGDRVFVLAGGGDDGITLFALLPDGRLLYLDSLADTMAASLQNVRAIAAAAVSGQIQVFATSEAEQGITHLALDLGVIGITVQAGVGQATGTDGADVLVAGAATTLLAGGVGDDILVAAANATVPLEMWGGAGRDRFVPGWGVQRLTIIDFDPGIDLLDLTLLPMLRSVQQLQITQTARGAMLRFGAVEIEIITHNSRPLSPSYFTDAELLALTRYAPYIEEERLEGTASADQMVLESEGGQAWGRDGNDTITGAVANVTIDGGAGDDLIVVHQGENRLLGGDGNDVLYLGTGNDFAAGGAGHDAIYGGGGANLIYTGYGRDSIYGGSGADTVYGAGGGNLVLGHDGHDWLYASAGGDFLAGGAGNDVIYGGAGNDTIYLGMGNDFTGGGAGNDVIYGGAGANVIYTGLGNDTVYGGSGADAIVGSGTGTNILLGNDGNDTVYAGNSGDFVAGGAGNDVLLGGDGNDVIYLGAGNDFAGGGAGNDIIHAGAGTNRIYAGYGDDTVVAGYGRDVITGGPGADHFVFGSSAQIGIGAARDVITDFTAGVDKIDLSALGLQFIGAAGFSGVAGELRYIPGYVVGDINGDAVNDFAIELSGAPTLTADDFLF
jgi:Ca2+-binding RTX toxin-like protein